VVILHASSHYVVYVTT